MKLYVRSGKVVLRPTLKIRNTGYARNHWQELVKANAQGTTFCGASTVKEATVKEVIQDYFAYFKRAGFEPIWKDEN